MRWATGGAAGSEKSCSRCREVSGFLCGVDRAGSETIHLGARLLRSPIVAKPSTSRNREIAFEPAQNL